LKGPKSNQTEYTDTTELPITLTRILNLSTLGLLAVVSGFNVFGAQTEITLVPGPIVQNVERDRKPRTTKEVVSEYFADLPIMVDIARCESQFRQNDKDGTTLRGVVNSADVGVMQINEKYHLVDSKKLGYDIHTIEGNMEYARYLYEKQGARPWISSSACWAKYSNIANN
jgi:hypothetical protein